MNKNSWTLTVFFENPFWVGVFEEYIDGQLSVCKVTFGAEPKINDINYQIFKRTNQLRFSQSTEIDKKERPLHPKRMQREVHKQLQLSGAGTKSQQLLKLQHEQMKKDNSLNARKHREDEKEKSVIKVIEKCRERKKVKHSFGFFST